MRVDGYGGVFGRGVGGEGGGGRARVEGGCGGHFGGGSALGELKDGVGEVSVHLFKEQEIHRGRCKSNMRWMEVKQKATQETF